MENFLNTLLQAVTPIITLLIEVGIVLLVAFATKFIKKYLTKIGISIDNDQLSAIENLVYQTVIKLNQTTVDKMKELSPDGKLSEEQQSYIYELAYKNILEALSEDQLGLIEKIYGSDTEGIETLIENMVVKAKENKTSYLSEAILVSDTDAATDVEKLM